MVTTFITVISGKCVGFGCAEFPFFCWWVCGSGAGAAQDWALWAAAWSRCLDTGVHPLIPFKVSPLKPVTSYECCGFVKTSRSNRGGGRGRGTETLSLQMCMS
jgi:hypothetical protein